MTQDGFLRVRILLVEDETFIRETIRRLLRSLDDMEIREAADGTAALGILRGGFQPDIIFCDVGMAPMDGLTFVRAVRAATDAELAATQVIVLTTSADREVVLEFSGLGNCSYLLKPASRKLLGEHVAAAVRRADAGRRARTNASAV